MRLAKRIVPGHEKTHIVTLPVIFIHILWFQFLQKDHNRKQPKMTFLKKDYQDDESIKLNFSYWKGKTD